MGADRRPRGSIKRPWTRPRFSASYLTAWVGQRGRKIARPEGVDTLSVTDLNMPVTLASSRVRSMFPEQGGVSEHPFGKQQG